MQRNTLVALASFALSAPTFSQSIQSVSPPAASPGTEVLIEGSGLDALTFVQFRFQVSIQASTSGSSISYVNEVAPTIESAERERTIACGRYLAALGLTPYLLLGPALDRPSLSGTRSGSRR